MKNGLSTGSTLLNLALTDDPNIGFPLGKYLFLVGDSQSGKTFLSVTCCAEATINPEFKDYRFIYDNVEDGMLMDLDHLFCEELADRMEPPGRLGDAPVFSHTIQSFYYHLDDALRTAGWDVEKGRPTGKRGRPFIYILDSMDSLDSDSAAKKFAQQKKAYRKSQAKAAGETPDGDGGDEKVAGSYGDGKAKVNSEYLRKAMPGLKHTGSILIIISQTRDDITSRFAGAKTRAGGRALRFYATAEIWSKVVGTHTKTIHDKDRKIGNRIALDVRKNRITGKLASVEIDIYPSLGFDDLGTNIDYLVEENFWPLEKLTINAKGLDISATREKLIRMVEKRGLEGKVRELCGVCWAEIQAKMVLPRKNKYQAAMGDDSDKE